MADWRELLASGSHPIWKILGAVVAFGGMVVMASHGSTHAQDFAGAGGAGLGGYILRSLMGGGKEA